MRKKNQEKIFDVEDINYALTSFLLYESANMPQITSWIKKRLKGQEQCNAKDIIKSLPKKSQKFIRSMNPSAYKNVLDILRLNDMEALFEEYKKIAPEFRQENFAENSPNIDVGMRATLALLSDNTKDIDMEDQTVAYFFGKIYALCVDNIGYTQQQSLVSLQRKKMEGSFIFDDVEPYLLDVLSEMPWEAVAYENSEKDHVVDIFISMMAKNAVIHNDLWKKEIPKKDLQWLVRLACTMTDMSEYEKEAEKIAERANKLDEEASSNKFDFNFGNIFDEDVLGLNDRSKSEFSSINNKYDDLVERAFKELFNKISFYMIIYKFILLYKDARDVANNAIDENIDLKIALEKEKNHVNKPAFDTKKDKSLAEQKQKQLNELQIKYEKLQLQYQKLESENDSLKKEQEFLNSIIEQEDFGNKNDNDDENVSIAESYPKGTVLFGGRDSWRKRFAAAHPEVKVLSGVDNFPENVVSSKTPLVLLNSKYMSHRFFYKIRRLQQRQGWKMEYIK